MCDTSDREPGNTSSCVDPETSCGKLGLYGVQLWECCTNLTKDISMVAKHKNCTVLCSNMHMCRTLHRITFLPVTYFLVDTWMLTVKPFKKFEMCFMSGNELQTHVTPLTHMWHRWHKHTWQHWHTNTHVTPLDTQTHMWHHWHTNTHVTPLTFIIFKALTDNIYGLGRRLFHSSTKTCDW